MRTEEQTIETVRDLAEQLGVSENDLRSWVRVQRAANDVGETLTVPSGRPGQTMVWVNRGR